MPSERVQRQIDRLLDQCEEAIAQRDWQAADAFIASVLVADPENGDALTYRAMTEKGRQAEGLRLAPAIEASDEGAVGVPSTPAAFCNGRYRVKKFLGEGGKKRVFLAADTLLDRDVAF